MTKTNVYGIKEAPMQIMDVSQSNGKGTVTGIITSYNWIDHDKDVGIKGHLSKSIAERGPGSEGRAKIKHLLQHEWEKILTVPKVLEDRDFVHKGMTVTGLYFESELDFRQKAHYDTYLKYEDGTYDNHSYGFRYVNLAFVEKGSDEFNRVLATLVNPEDAGDYFWIQKETMMYEFSTVGVGSNELTPNLGVKSKDEIVGQFQKLTKALRSGRYTDETMEVFDMKAKQIEQMILSWKPSIKDTISTEPPQGTQTEVEKLYKLLKF